ncbi:unnamed protein product [Cladocopium goreaui]|uniref:phosphoglucomutase (alpha-D-glucose-1,6-bisphosphate-dependent) n=1 Tax=Cladocopium goreaui TaxID=2562237 RepID=A0A9P1CZY4_9DINO|nr:unnamed protein product [Cladocopium goreaui]
MAEPHFFGDADVTPLAAAALAVWLLIFLWRSWKLLRPASACSDGLEYALALRSAAVYVLGICSVPLLFPCRSAPEEPVSSWATCSKSPYSFIPTNLMRIFHILPFWYAFLVTPYLGGLVKSICDAILGVSLGLVAVSFLNLMLPGGAAGPEYLTSDYFERAWLPFRYSTPAAFSLALCLTYGLFVSNLSVAKKQYAMCIYSELLVPFMSPHTRTGFRAVCWDWDFQWNWNGSAMCGFWLVSLAVLLSIITLGMLPTRRSIETHTAKWASALALAQLAEDTAGCLEYLMTILQQEAWKFQFHADSSNFYIKHLGLRRTRAEAILALTPWEPKESKNLTKVASFLRQLRQLLRIQSEQMRYFGQSMPKGKQLKLEDFLLACNDGLSLVARDCRSNADLTEETCEELKRIAEKADEILIQTLRDIEDDQMASIQMAFVDKLRSWPAAFRALGGVTSGASSESNETWSNRNWFALRNTTSWLLALLWSLYFRNYSCGCVVATSLIFSQTSGSSFEVNINRLLGICMGLAVGNIPALLIFSSTDPAADLTSVNYLLRVFMYFVVMFTTWTLAIFGYLATDSKYFRACLMWAALSGTEMFRHLPRVGMLDVQLFTAILDNVLAVMVVFMVDMVFAYMQGNDASEQVKAAVTRCIQRIATQLDTLKAGAPDFGNQEEDQGVYGRNVARYLANFVQSVFNTLQEENVPVQGGTLVVSGDGRFWNPEAIQIIIKMAFAAGVARVWCGTNGLLSTPATSAVIRMRGGKGYEPFGGFICSASHNPGGIDDDFGIKYNCENGGPAPEKLTNKMLEWTAKITELKSCSKLPDFDLSKPELYELPGGKFVEIFDCVSDHLAVLKNCFDFEGIKKLIAHPQFSMTYDSMCGVQGPYALRVFEKELGAPPGTCKNATPLPDFGGPSSAWHGHADPNLTYAVELVKEMGLNKEGNKVETGKAIPCFGAAADGDADRNMICGAQFFVSPSDSLAMIVANADLIPQQLGGGAEVQKWFEGMCQINANLSCIGFGGQKDPRKNIPCFEVPTGWKFFGNLMDSGTSYFPGKETYTPFICGEESFGTGADHVREKDGMWAVMAWLQILAKKTEAAGKLVSVEDVANAHWKEYGRNYYARYDYEGVDKAKAEEMFAAMEAQVGQLVGKEFQGGLKIKINDMFEYVDPVDGSISKKQGLRFIFEDNSRIIFRLSGTGVAGATVRLYLEKYEPPTGDLTQHQFEVGQDFLLTRGGCFPPASVQGIRELQLDTLQRDIKDARFWDSEIQKEGLVWTRLWKNAYKAESVPALLDHFDEVYVWLNAVQNSGSRCDPELAAKIVRDLPKSVVERCHTFVRAIKLVLQGLDDSLHRELHHLLEGSKRDSPEMGISSQSICNMLQGDAAEGTASDMESSPAESHPDDVAQRAAAHAVHLSVKALRMTLQKIGGLLAAGSALAAKDWGVEARRRNAKGEQSFTMDDFMVPKSKSGDLRRRLRSSVKALVLALEQRRFKAGRRPAKKRGQKESPQKQETDPQVNVTLKDLRVEAKELRRAHRAVSASETKSLGGFWHTPSPCRQREFVCPVCGSGGGVSLTPLDVSHQSADFERLELEKAILEKKAIGLQWKLRSHDQDILDLQADLKGAYGLCQELHGQLKKQTDEFQSFMVGVRASIGHWTAHQHQLKEEMDELADQCAPGHAEVVKLAEELQLARQKLQASQRRKSRRESTKQHQATIQALQLRIRELGHEASCNRVD